MSNISQALVNLAYALDGRPEPAPETTAEEMVTTINNVACRLRYELGVVTKAYLSDTLRDQYDY